jgi:hypothetical protein
MESTGKHERLPSSAPRRAATQGGQDDASLWGMRWNGRPAVTLPVRCLIVLPLAFLLAYMGVRSPRNSWDFSANFALAYATVFMLSFLFLELRPREQEHTPR